MRIHLGWALLILLLNSEPAEFFTRCGSSTEKTKKNNWNYPQKTRKFPQKSRKYPQKPANPNFS